MAFKISTGLRDYLLATGALTAAMNGGVIRIYGNDAAAPTSPDDAVGSATLLVTISNNGGGTGINFDTSPVDGVIVKAPAETWKGEIVATGTAAFYRFSSLSDTGAASTTERRLQGTVGLPASGADMWFSSVSFVSGNEKQLDYFAVGMPESA